MKIITIAILFSLVLITESFGQNQIMTIRDAENKGMSISHLDSIYKSAVHSDPNLAVFKSGEEQQQLQTAYISYFQELGKFLKQNNFNWEKPTRSFNRIYMNKDGTVEYFLFNFQQNQVSEEKQKEFARLLSRYTQENKFPITADEKFAQCSPIVYGN